MTDEPKPREGWDDRTDFPNSGQATPHRHRKFAGVVLLGDSPHAGLQMPLSGVWAMLGEDPHEILSGFFELQDSGADRTRSPHRWRYVFPASSVLFFIEDLGLIEPEA